MTACPSCFTRPSRNGRRCTSCASWGIPKGALYCTCATSDFDAIDQCRRCLRADARAPRVAAAIARVAARRQEVA